MVSRDGVLLGIIWSVFTLLLAIVTVMILNPSPSSDMLGFLVGPKLIFFSIIIALAALEYRLPRTEAKGQESPLSHTFVTIITFGLLFSLLFSVSIDLAHAYSLKINDYAYSVSIAFFITSIYFITTLFAKFLYTTLIAQR
jgi:hypothetical protein